MQLIALGVEMKDLMKSLKEHCSYINWPHLLMVAAFGALLFTAWYRDHTREINAITFCSVTGEIPVEIGREGYCVKKEHLHAR
jgi:hypothetical protein